MLEKIVLWGATGSLGSRLREPLSKLCKTLVSCDVRPTDGPNQTNETFIEANITDLAKVTEIQKDATMVVHFVGIADERDFDTLLGPNYLSNYNVWEAARLCGVQRVVYASSIHAIGLTKISDGIPLDIPHNPDSYYGLSKCFAEDLAKLYWHKCGIESVCLRISSCTEKPQNMRALHTWLSPKDLVQLVERSIVTAIVEHTIIYGVSNNTRSAFDNSKADFLGYRPVDNAEDYAQELAINAPAIDPQDQSAARIGGPFARTELGESGVALIKRLQTP